ncbi:MAG: PTS sugar transporter subunit IIA [Bombilactobacillus sp.]
MKKYLIASHGKLASGLKSSLEVLTGIKDNVTVINAYLADQPVNVAQEVQKFLKTLNKEDIGIIFTDLVGGSVNREVVEQTKDLKQVFVVSSVNLPTILAVVLDQEPMNVAHLKELVASAPVEVMSLNSNVASLSDDDFLV